MRTGRWWLGLAVAVLLTGAARSDDGGKLPADLASVPSDNAMLMSIRVADLWDSEPAQAVRKQGAKEVEEVSGQIKKTLGVDLKDVERVLMTIADVGPGEPLLIVTTRKATDQKAVLKQLMPQAAEEKRKGKVIHTQKGMERFGRQQTNAVHFLDDRTYAVGLKQDMEHWLDAEPDARGQLQPARVAAAGKHHFVMAVNLEKLYKAIGDNIPPQEEALRPLLNARYGMMTANLDGKAGARADAVIEYAGEKGATEGLKAAEALHTLAKTTLGEGLKQAPKELTSKKALKLMEQFDAAVNKGVLKQDGASVKGSMALASDPEAVVGGLIEGFAQVKVAATRMEVSNNLKQLGLAFHNYESTHGSMPPAAIYNKEGKALLSWRVLILPYIGENKLYNEFKLDEPWDSEHNKKLLTRMPAVFSMPGADKQNKANETHYLVFTGKDTLFQGARGAKLIAIPDGTSNTFLIVEANKSVPWSKPEDLPYDAQKDLPKLGALKPDIFQATFADGSVRSIKTNIKEGTLRLLITPSDGTPIPDFD